MEEKLNNLIAKVETISEYQNDVLERISSAESNIGAIKKTPGSYYAHGVGAGGVGFIIDFSLVFMQMEYKLQFCCLH